MLDRTTVVLPPDLKERALSRAQARGISFAELLRQAVEAELSRPPKARAKSGDPFLDNVRVYDDQGPTDWSTRVDQIVYGALESELRGHRPVSPASSAKRSCPIDARG